MSTPSVVPFLMFTGRAEEAMRFYEKAVPGSQILDVQKWGPGGPGAAGTVKRATMRIGSQTVMFTDSPPVHGFTFTPSISLFVTCETAAEVDAIFGALSEGGQVMMPLGAYPFSPRFGWTGDRFGVSWQVSAK